MGLTNLQRLESEAIHILRETVAETERPVLLRSIDHNAATSMQAKKRDGGF